MSMEKRGGIRTEAVGRFYIHGERTYELSKEISKKANEYTVLFDYDYDVHKMVELAIEINKKVELLVLSTKAIADSTPKEDKE
jgi:hypothetical protein